MFDYHIHSTVSFDGQGTPEEMVAAAKRQGLREICFTDHRDYEKNVTVQTMVFDMEDYHRAYDSLQAEGIKIRMGMEFGLQPYNQQQLLRDLELRHYDFVLGSVHFVEQQDVYFAPYWQGKSVFQAERRFLEETLDCVRHHDHYDVLAHLTFLSKAKAHPAPRPIPYGEHSGIIDEILRTLAQKGKGLELNTSGVDRCGDFLPDAEYFRRFKELGGKIVTLGSDAHAADRVGQYADRGCALLKEIFGYVCTFENREPVFHRL